MKRKVQKTGGSTLIVSLPKEWTNRVNLESGDEVVICHKDDDTLVILPKGVSICSDDKIKRKITLEFTPEYSLEEIFRMIVAYYLTGYDMLEVYFKNEDVGAWDKLTEYKIYIKNNLRDLIGMEVVDEEDNKILLQNFVDCRDISFKDALLKTMKIIKTMLNDTERTILYKDDILVNDIVQRDKEVNRFHYLLLRQLNECLNEHLSESVEIKPNETIIFSNIVKNLERIGDHCKRIARESPKIENNNSEIIKKIISVRGEVQSIFENTCDYLLTEDHIEANKLITQSNKVIEKIKSLNSELFENYEWDKDIPHISFILDSLKRICQYSNDICEGIIVLGIYMKK